MLRRLALLTVALALALPAVAIAAAPPYRSSVQPLSPAVQEQLIRAGAWHRGCPVALSASGS